MRKLFSNNDWKCTILEKVNLAKTIKIWSAFAFSLVIPLLLIYLQKYTKVHL